MSGEPIKILLIEDADDVLLVRRMLAAAKGVSFDLKDAGQFAAGLECLETEGVDIVVLDLSLPGARGFDAFLKMRTQWPEMPVIVLADADDEGLAARAVREGAQDYLVKGGITGELLIRAIRHAIESAQVDVVVRQARDETEQCVEERTVELRSVNEMLRESEENFRALADNANDGILIAAGDGIHVYANRRAAEMTGYSVAELVEMGIKELAHPDEFEMVMERFRKRLGGEYTPRQYETALITKDGREVPIEITAARTIWQGRPADLVVLRDITERKQTEEALHRRDAILETVSYGAERFLREGDWESRIEELLERLGNAMKISRAYIFENVLEDEQLVMRQRFEWAAPGITPEIDNPANQRIPYTDGFELWLDIVGEGQVLGAHTRDLPPRVRETFARQSILSIATVPIFVGAEWWGFIGFDECKRERDWSPVEMEALRTAANTLGAAIQRQQAEEALRREHDRAQQYLDIAEVMLVALDAEGKIALINRKGCRLLGYEEGELAGKSWFDTCLPPQTREDVRTVFHMLIAGEVDPVEYYENPVLTKDGEERIVAWHNTIVRDRAGNIVGTLSSGEDITDSKQAEEALQRHANRLEALHEIDQGILTAQSPGAIAQVALSHIRQLVPCHRASVTMFDHEAGQVAVLAVSADGETRLAAGARDSMSIGTAEDLLQGKVRVTDDILAISQPSAMEQILQEEGARSYINVPLLVHGQLIGTLNLGANSPGAFTSEHADIAREVAAPLAIAIQQAWLHEQIQSHAEELEERVADRTRELAALYEISAVASESLGLATTLQQALERALAAMKSTAGFIHLLDEEGKMLHLAVHKGLPPDIVAQRESVPLGSGLVGQVIEHGKPLIVPDAAVDPRVAIQVPPTAPTIFGGVPMRAGGQVVGVFSVFRDREQAQFNDEEIALLASVADQVGVVVESARLRQQAERAAVLEERQRLARELHDSVTQSLYSLTLMAETGRRSVNAGDLEGLANYLSRLGGIAQQALKEMRLLIYELRPPVLRQDRLEGALQQRLEAVEGRAGVEARLLVEIEVELTEPVEEAFYRIALEALNNALKHAAATSVTVRIHSDGERAELQVVDDGRGFSLEAVRDKGGMGLITMRERAERLGGTLTILSSPGEGTRVKAVVSSDQSAIGD